MALFQFFFFSELLKLHLHTSWADKFQWNLSVTCSLSPFARPQSSLELKYLFDPLWILSVARNSCLKPLCCGASVRPLLCSRGCSPLLHPQWFSSFSIWPFCSPLLLQVTCKSVLACSAKKSPASLFDDTITVLLSTLQPSYPLCYPNPHLLFSWLLSQTLFPLLFCLNPYSQTIFP